MSIFEWLGFRGSRKPRVEEAPEAGADSTGLVRAEPLEGVIASTRAERRENRIRESIESKAQTRARNLADPTKRRQELLRTVRGRSYMQWVEDIEQMKREGRYHLALDILYECIAAAELEVDGPPCWYTWQAAIIHRKMRNYKAEVEVLERYLDACQAVIAQGRGAGIARSRMVGEFPERLAKAKELLRKQQEKQRG